MLAYVLALVIGLGSIAMYMAAFFFPEVHRKNDFIWSGVGLFYALVLWVCAGRITGGVLLGQMASVALLGWLGWQTLTLRRAIAAPEQQTAIPSQNELQDKLKGIVPAGKLQGLQQRVTGLFSKGKSPAKKDSEATAGSVKSATSAVTEMVETTATLEPTATPTPESPAPTPPHPPDPELIEAAQKSASPDMEESQADAATPIEEIAPEVELAPPAEPPGSGDPEDRKAEP